MITIDPENVRGRDMYKLLIGTIAPRPIAFVTTLAENGAINAAPFSFFNVVSSIPPLLSVSVQRKNGIEKDTAKNALREKCFVIHMTDERIVEEVNKTSASLPSHVSELAETSLSVVDSKKIHVPAIEEAQVRFECILERHIPLGEDETITTDLLIGRIVFVHMQEEIYNDGKIIYDKLKPVSRLAGNDYAKLGSVFSLIRPK